MDEQNDARRTPEQNEGSGSWRAVVAVGCLAICLIGSFSSSVPGSRNRTVVLFNPLDITLAGCAAGFGLLSAVRREALWPLGLIAAIIAVTPFVLQLFPAFR